MNNDLTWSLHVHNHLVSHSTCPALSTIPEVLNLSSLIQLLQLLDSLYICSGQTDSHLVSMVSAKKGKILSPSGKVVASVESYAPVFLNGSWYSKTVRTSECHLVSHTLRCEICSKYRPTLRAIYHRWSKGCSNDMSDTSSHTNERYSFFLTGFL